MTGATTVVLFIFCFVFKFQCSNSSPACNEINDLQNGVDERLGMNATDTLDLIGGVSTSFYKFYGGIAGQKQNKSEKCETQGFFMGKYAIRMSVVPVGCCSVCCIIDKMENYVEFYFTNKKLNGTTKRVSLSLKPRKLKKIGFDKNLETIIFVHGFLENKLSFSSYLLTEAYLSRNESYNILIVGWSDLSPLPWYNTAVENVKLVGKAVARFIKFFDSIGEMPIEKMHLIGLSLGAHVCGYIGKHLSKTKRIPRITGLDPAFPLYPLDDVNQRLSQYDADYVDVIHTDHGKFGFPTSIGHADFYPNYERANQPSCEHLFDFLFTRQIEEFLVCDHFHSVELYTESVRNPHSFPAVKMKSMDVNLTRKARFTNDAYMGFSASKSVTGDYYLITNEHSPFGKSVEEQSESMKAAEKIQS